MVCDKSQPYDKIKGQRQYALYSIMYYIEG